MVTPSDPTDKQIHNGPPKYALSRIQELAAQGKVTYASPKVFRDTENFGYTPEKVHHCLSTLTDSDYSRSLLYPGRTAWMDEYKVTYQFSDDRADDLYIKLMLGKGCLVVALCSFHPEGSL